jgi:hypothetical protein
LAARFHKDGGRIETPDERRAAPMIHVRFMGNLGNQMFQYAAARLAAERLGCPFVLSQGWFSWRHALTRRPSMALFQMFPRLHPGLLPGVIDGCERYGGRLARRLEQRIFPTRFRPWSPGAAPWEGLEGYDPGYLEVRKFTRLMGYFQSPRYLQGHETRVRQWFADSNEQRSAIAQRWSDIGIDPADAVAVHVRLSDYRKQTPLGENPQGGWLLPRDYYRKALAVVGRGRKIALFSDEPELAEEYIGRKAEHVSAARDPGIDFRMMSSCTHMIIANSTFSWWAAWLNPAPSPVIVAPRFFLGHSAGTWYPKDIQVEGWHYV